LTGFVEKGATGTIHMLAIFSGAPAVRIKGYCKTMRICADKGIAVALRRENMNPVSIKFKGRNVQLKSPLQGISGRTADRTKNCVAMCPFFRLRFGTKVLKNSP
jgi:hypothetical protein